MEEPFPEVDGNFSINDLSKLFNNENRAVIVNLGEINNISLRCKI